MQAVGAGLAKLGIKAKLSYSPRADTKYVACWGWRVGKELRNQGHEVLVLERGYIGDRFKYTSIGWNGLNGRGLFAEYPDDCGQRFRQHGGVIKPWKSDGDYAVIMGQVPGDMNLLGKNLMEFYKEKLLEIKDHYDGLPVIFRPHPVLKSRGIRQHVKGALESVDSLDGDLANAKFTVCFNSNSAVESILSGVPCVVEDHGSMAWDVASHSIYALKRPDREAWAHDLAWKQWAMDEIESGKALQGALCLIGL